jgi:hypothetical protein
MAKGDTAAALVKEGNGSSGTVAAPTEGDCIAEAFSCEARWESGGCSVQAIRMPIMRCRPNAALRKIMSMGNVSGIRPFGSP